MKIKITLLENKLFSLSNSVESELPFYLAMHSIVVSQPIITVGLILTFFNMKIIETEVTSEVSYNNIAFYVDIGCTKKSLCQIQ